ncbi:MAG: adenylate/guanylate cyclase domain-containing protein [Armatimonadota bacterium]|nr:adenylate/guanylate cyclase domain-containing protein [Armatimonadota bacterium]
MGNGRQGLRLVPAFFIPLAVGLLTYGASYSTPIQRLSVTVTDWLLSLKPVETDPRIVLVTIDDKTLKKMGQFPLDRRIYARVVDLAADRGAEAIVFDLLFTEPTPSDEALARSALRFGKVVFGCAFATTPTDLSSLADRLLLNRPEGLTWEAPGFLLPVKVLTQSAFAIGFVNILPDSDGFRRTVPLAMALSKTKKALPSLALAGAMALRQEIRSVPGFDKSGNGLYHNLQIPILLPSSENPTRRFPTLSLVDLVEGKRKTIDLKGKVLLVGVTATGVTDIHPVPWVGSRVGLEIQAAALNSILKGFLVQPSGLWVQVAIVLFAGSLIGLTAATERITWLAGVFLVLFAAEVIVPYGLISKGILYPPLPTILSSLASFLTATILVAINIHTRLVKELRHRVPADLADLILAKPSSLPGLGERKVITVLFADIRDFTAATANLSPYEVQSLLNDFFTAMTELVEMYGGHLDKFIGDGLMALFGALKEMEDHTERAVVCACHMVEEIEQMQTLWQRLTGQSLAIGIGIHRGPAVVGELGSRQLSQFTAVGFTVNLAHRLEELTKDLHAPIVVSKDVYEWVADLIIAEEVPETSVAGLSGPVTVYKVVGLNPEAKRLRSQFWVAG